VQIYRGLKDQGEILREQLSHVTEQRRDLVGQLSEQGATGVVRTGIEKQITALDARIDDLNQQIAKSDLAVATAAAVPGATVRPPDIPRNKPDPDMVFGVSAMILFAFIMPIIIAFSRRIWRRSAKAEVTLPPEVAERMSGLERGMEAIALEVERIGEGQRFMTQALASRGEVPAIPEKVERR
jgi:hypothetical protein